MGTCVDSDSPQKCPCGSRAAYPVVADRCQTFAGLSCRHLDSGQIQNKETMPLVARTTTARPLTCTSFPNILRLCDASASHAGVPRILCTGENLVPQLGRSQRGEPSSRGCCRGSGGHFKRHGERFSLCILLRTFSVWSSLASKQK